jgi:hypothetical protein
MKADYLAELNRRNSVKFNSVLFGLNEKRQTGYGNVEKTHRFS